MQENKTDFCLMKKESHFLFMALNWQAAIRTRIDGTTNTLQL